MTTTVLAIDEQAALREQIKSVELPEGVRFQKIEPIEEHTGELAWRITFSVSGKKPRNKRTFSELQRVRDAVTDLVLPMNSGKWPFVSFTEGK